MKLSTRILLFLFTFALLPLVFAVAINLPLVLDRVELFYRQAILQHLRADFRDLDQHLASRNEMARLLAKLPEPGAMMGTESPEDEQQIALGRVQYTEWINRILSDQLDILDIVFVDELGDSRFWLSRDGQSHQWKTMTTEPYLPPVEQITDVFKTSSSLVKFSPVRVNPDPDTPAHAITLQLLAPIVSAEGSAAIGAVVMTVDIGGLMRRNPQTLWVQADGRYLQVAGLPHKETLAFNDYPGLEQTLAAGQIALWEGRAADVIWVPLLRTESNEALWVGRPVNEQPLQTFRTTLIVRVLTIILGLILMIGLSARWIATRVEALGNELIRDISRVLERNDPVIFSWRGSPEIQKLGEDLSVLARKHASNSRNLAAHTAELEASNRYKSEFLANVSHELKTPLNSILSLSKLLLDKHSALSAENQEQVQVINSAGEDLRRLIDNILDLSKIESGQLEMHVESVNLPQLAHDLVTLMQPQFADKGLSLVLQIDASVVENIQTDADKLRQIIKNFLGNAVKFTDQGTVELELLPAPSPYAVILQVRDAGIGISREKHQLIFEAFKQADGSTSRRFGGTGLGLSISNQLAEMLGGEITLESEPGKGALFSLLLRATPPDESVQKPQNLLIPSQSGPVAAGSPVADFSGVQVLLVARDVRRLLHLSQLLESWGVSIVVAGDEDEVCETLDDEPGCDLLLVSGEMPAADSYATIQCISVHVENRNLNVVNLDLNDSPEMEAEVLLQILKDHSS